MTIIIDGKNFYPCFFLLNNIQDTFLPREKIRFRDETQFNTKLANLRNDVFQYSKEPYPA